MSERHTSAGTKDLTRAVINMNCTNVKTYTGSSMRSGMACTVFLREYLRLSTTIVINDATCSAAIIPVTTLKSVMEYHIVSIQNMHVVSLKINSGNGVRLKIFCNIALTKSAAGSNVPNATAKIYPTTE